MKFPKLMNKPILSILILSIPERFEALRKLYLNLENQISKHGLGQKVEILTFLDNKSKSIAEKRNFLLKSVSAEHFAFLDDDDTISEHYLHLICDQLQKTPSVDCITFEQECCLNGEYMHVTFGLGNPHQSLYRLANGRLGPIKRPPYHMCVWKTLIGQSETFNSVFSADGQSIEDIDWLLRLYKKSRTAAHIPKVLHFYNYSSETTRSTR